MHQEIHILRSECRKSNKPINSLYFHLTQRNAILFWAIDNKNYEYLHAIPIREPNNSKIVFKSIRNSELNELMGF